MTRQCMRANTREPTTAVTGGQGLGGSEGPIGIRFLSWAFCVALVVVGAGECVITHRVRKFDRGDERRPIFDGPVQHWQAERGVSRGGGEMSSRARAHGPSLRTWTDRARRTPRRAAPELPVVGEPHTGVSMQAVGAVRQGTWVTIAKFEMAARAGSDGLGRTFWCPPKELALLAAHRGSLRMLVKMP